MSQPRPLHFWSIRNRIVLSVMGIVICTLAVTVLVSRHQLSQALDRSNYLRKHINRFAGTKDYLAKSLAGVVTVVASDPGIISDLSCQPSAPRPSADKPDDTASAPRVCHRNRRWKQVRKSLAGTIAPELWLLTDKNDEPVDSAKSSWNSTWLRQQSFYTQVAKGLRLTAWVRAGKRTYLAAGAPVTGKGGQRLGTVIIAVDATRLLSDFAKLSDAVVKKRQNLMLVANGQVLASSISPKTVPWSAQATSFAPKNQLTRAEGTRSVKVMHIAGHDYDFSTRPASVFIKGTTTPATLVMFRQRTAHEVKQARFERPILWTGVGLVLLAGLVGLLLAYGIVKPLRGFIGYTKEMSSGGGDLTYRFPIARRDELGELATNLNNVLAQLQELFDQVRQAALELGNSAAEISVTAGELFRRSQDESTKVEDITASVSTMNKAIQQLSVTAQQAAQRAGTGGSAVGEASTAIGEIRDVVSDISDQVRMLGDRSARIGSIVETIGQIADQTSLLALNASIEAAHAGEHGKGFAVVANEVSNLAERVNKSARQIEEQLAQIRLLTDKAVRSADTAATTVDKSVAQVDSTFGELQELLRLVQDIGAREQEQAQLSDEIARHMEDIFLLVREGLQANEQTVTEGERLKRLGEVLLTSVHQFKTSGSGGKSLEAPSQRRGLLGSGSGRDNA